MKDTRKDLIRFGKDVFDIKNEPMPKGSWWYWMWLFFFNNPDNPEEPRQLMILWSTKNEKEIESNNLKFSLENPVMGNNIKGVAAAWYFDGNRMHHNLILERCDIKMLRNGLQAKSCTSTSFRIEKTINKIKIGDRFSFNAEAKNEHNFLEPAWRKYRYIGGKGYSIMEMKHLDLEGRVDGKPIKGSAYFQRVFFNIPYPSWHWGIIHFDKGDVLTYLFPSLFGKNIQKNVMFFSKGKLHRFDDASIKFNPRKTWFDVRGKNKGEKISFRMKCYSHASWTFKKRYLGLLQSKLVYNEYPAYLSSFSFQSGSKTVRLKDLGRTIGNAERGTGLLI